jgi:hypothetical protein
MPAEEKKDEVQKAETVETKNETDSDEELNFAEMDLTVEAVEERISPSETNVFDK